MWPALIGHLSKIGTEKSQYMKNNILENESFSDPVLINLDQMTLESFYTTPSPPPHT